jgi:hypothetical protein
MGDYCNGTNWDSTYGFFSLDFRDGEVRYRHAVDVEGVEVTPKFADNFLKAPVGTMRRHYRDLQAIMNGNVPSTLTGMVSPVATTDKYLCCLIV